MKDVTVESCVVMCAEHGAAADARGRRGPSEAWGASAAELLSLGRYKGVKWAVNTSERRNVYSFWVVLRSLDLIL